MSSLPSPYTLVVADLELEAVGADLEQVPIMEYGGVGAKPVGIGSDLAVGVRQCPTVVCFFNGGVDTRNRGI